MDGSYQEDSSARQALPKKLSKETDSHFPSRSTITAVDKNQNQEHQWHREKLTKKPLQPVQTKANLLLSLHSSQPPGHQFWHPFYIQGLCISQCAYTNIFLPSSQTSRGTNNCYCSLFLKCVHLWQKSKSEWTQNWDGKDMIDVVSVGVHRQGILKYHHQRHPRTQKSLTQTQEV